MYIHAISYLTGGLAVECKRYHSRLAELVATKNSKSYGPLCHGSGLGCPLRS